MHFIMVALTDFIYRLKSWYHFKIETPTGNVTQQRSFEWSQFKSLPQYY